MYALNYNRKNEMLTLKKEQLPELEIVIKLGLECPYDDDGKRLY